MSRLAKPKDGEEIINNAQAIANDIDWIQGVGS